MSKTKYIITTIGGENIDLTKATVLRSNNLYPFGRHNYAVYETPEGIYVLATNIGEREIMLTTYERLTQEAATNYRHRQEREY
ncbi:MAG: hypothetical protein LPJ89_01925 [Hymenobacteraceae bacterium]|nr:hypothetical protein [Hymenobacteraceae bacterium]MDX5394716.1 hypothetical protein [Hymenobacteraceae bacterium]MDX5442521.1 hypothetical protein [Hymenobacteraceae bacterium]MDX5510749.1 hypothetical protein [Hymenobacteraceae bacterium]